MRNRHHLLSNRKAVTLHPFIQERSRTPYDKTDVIHSLPRVSHALHPLFFGGLQETRPTFDSLERFSVLIGEVNMISITAVEYILYNVNCT